VVIGGATTGGSLASGAFTFNPSTGALEHFGNLTTAVDDACGTVIAGQDVVFGGSAPAASSTVQQLTQPSTAGAAPSGSGVGGGAGRPVSASVIGSLPEARTDAAVATIGATTYLVGGDDGSSSLAQVLATSDGHTFVQVGSLAQPVASAAVAAVGKTLYVFGGQSMSQSAASSPLDTIQSVDLSTRRSRVVGHLPEPLAQASAVTVGDRVLLIGGVTSGTSGTSGSSGASHSGAAGSAASQPVSSSPATTPVPTVWSFDPATRKVSVLSQLPTAVSRAGAAVVGSVVWVIGGDSGGSPVAAVQSITVVSASSRR